MWKARQQLKDGVTTNGRLDTIMSNFDDEAHENFLESDSGGSEIIDEPENIVEPDNSDEEGSELCSLHESDVEFINDDSASDKEVIVEDVPKRSVKRLARNLERTSKYLTELVAIPNAEIRAHINTCVQHARTIIDRGMVLLEETPRKRLRFLSE